MFLRERRILRDLAIGALILSVLALTPMIFWRILMSEVLVYNAFNTFTVLCVGVFILLLTEAMLLYLRNYLLQIVTARVDTRLAEYIFDRLLDLQIDYFERHPVGAMASKDIYHWRGTAAGRLDPRSLRRRARHSRSRSARCWPHAGRPRCRGP